MKEMKNARFIGLIHTLSNKMNILLSKIRKEKGKE
jgi:hypothetical protein